MANNSKGFMKRDYPVALEDKLVRADQTPGYEHVSPYYYVDKEAVIIISFATSSLEGAGEALAWREDGDGYFVTEVRSKDGERKEIRRNRFTLEINGILPPGPDYHADHINGDKGDDRPENLRWLHRTENKPNGGTPKRLGETRAAMAQHEVQYGNSLISTKGQAKKASTTKKVVRDAARKRTYADVPQVPRPQGDEVLTMDWNAGEYDCYAPERKPTVAGYRQVIERRLKARKP